VGIGVKGIVEQIVDSNEPPFFSYRDPLEICQIKRYKKVRQILRVVKLILCNWN
jgi:hypothetical protein